MPHVSQQALREVQEALQKYEAEVEESPNLTARSKQTYLGHARHFVRWLDDDFVPGGGRSGEPVLG